MFKSVLDNSCSILENGTAIAVKELRVWLYKIAETLFYTHVEGSSQKKKVVVLRLKHDCGFNTFFRPHQTEHALGGPHLFNP